MVVASCFASLDNDTSFVTMDNDNYELPMLTYHQAGLWFESPRRLVCRYVLLDCRRYERYDEHGLSHWVAMPMQGFLWLQHQSIVVSGPLLLLSLALLGVTNLVEQLLLHPVLCVVLVTVLLFWRRMGQHKQKNK